MTRVELVEYSFIHVDSVLQHSCAGMRRLWTRRWFSASAGEAASLRLGPDSEDVGRLRALLADPSKSLESRRTCWAALTRRLGKDLEHKDYSLAVIVFNSSQRFEKTLSLAEEMKNAGFKLTPDDYRQFMVAAAFGMKPKKHLLIAKEALEKGVELKEKVLLTLLNQAVGFKDFELVPKLIALVKDSPNLSIAQTTAVCRLAVSLEELDVIRHLVTSKHPPTAALGFAQLLRVYVMHRDLHQVQGLLLYHKEKNLELSIFEFKRALSFAFSHEHWQILSTLLRHLMETNLSTEATMPIVSLLENPMVSRKAIVEEISNLLDSDCSVDDGRVLLWFHVKSSPSAEEAFQLFIKFANKFKDSLVPEDFVAITECLCHLASAGHLSKLLALKTELGIKENRKSIVSQLNAALICQDLEAALIAAETSKALRITCPYESLEELFARCRKNGDFATMKQGFLLLPESLKKKPENIDEIWRLSVQHKDYDFCLFNLHLVSPFAVRQDYVEIISACIKDQQKFHLVLKYIGKITKLSRFMAQELLFYLSRCGTKFQAEKLLAHVFEHNILFAREDFALLRQKILLETQAEKAKLAKRDVPFGFKSDNENEP